MRLALVAGARPNFMKIAPIVRALQRRGHTDWFLVHTGQHYDPAMSQVFFDELGLPKPDVWLGVGSGSQAEQTGRIMIGFEQACLARTPDTVVVVGDVNSTAAAALVAAKLGIRIAHVEAGLRSRDRRMPEEINRLVTDVLSDLLFAPSDDAVENLRTEGVEAAKIHMVGNVMVDSLLQHLPSADWRRVLQSLDLLADANTVRPYAVLTLHRPSNVDASATFEDVMNGIAAVASRIPVIFPVHPRARARVHARPIEGLRTIDPLGYLDFLALTSRAALVLTDSGGLQEETTVLGVPCLTVRETTERPITMRMGTNTLVGTSAQAIAAAAGAVLDGTAPARAQTAPPLWDGKTAERIVDILLRDTQ